MAKILYFDCFAGASGDMVLGALLDAGLPLAELEAALGSLLIPGYRLSAERVLRAGVSATAFRLDEGGEDEFDGHDAAGGHDHDHGHGHGHGHGHDHGHGSSHEPEPSPAPGRARVHSHAHSHTGPAQPHRHDEHRSLAEILALIAQSALSPRGRERATALFRRLAEAEAAIHGMSVEQVHLHEVGALDSIIDIVGAVFGIEWFGADRIVSSPLNVGGGMVRSAHGVFPVPAPATLRLLEGVPVYSSGIQMETVTPTGALLVTGHASEFGPVPAMRVARVGYGAGGREVADTPNVLRVLVGHDDRDAGAQRVVVLECEIDDMNPQIFGVVIDALYAAGALEVFYTPVQMKKNRPGTLLTVVAPPDLRDALAGIVFRETTTIGLRYQELVRACLDREIVVVETTVGPVRFKIARRGDEVLNASPEFEDCARLAAERSLPVKQVQGLAVQAYWESRRR
jgi:pyridinium-3,5-bisthiocarboxylic acid mononucleotide nickel chelatase